MPKVPSGKVPMPDVVPDRPRYLAVDAHIKSRRSLRTLATALEASRAVHVTDHGRVPGPYWIQLGIYTKRDDPVVAVRRYLAVFRKLPLSARRLLKHSAIEFDIGFESSPSSQRRRSGEWVLPTAFLNAVVRAGGHFRITVYPSSEG